MNTTTERYWWRKALGFAGLQRLGEHVLCKGHDRCACKLYHRLSGLHVIELTDSEPSPPVKWVLYLGVVLQGTVPAGGPVILATSYR